MDAAHLRQYTSSNALAFCRALECEWFLVPWAAGYQVRQLYWSLLGALHANSCCLNIAGLEVLIILILDDFVHVSVQTRAFLSTQKEMYWWDMCHHFFSHWPGLHDCIPALTLWFPCGWTEKHILWWLSLNPYHFGGHLGTSWSSCWIPIRCLNLPLPAAGTRLPL